jgi:cytochrome c-type biogenesis protein CcmH/NrfG
LRIPLSNYNPVFEMTITSQQGWKIAGAIVLMALTFALGYYAGGLTAKAPVGVQNSLTSADMEHAFGSVKQADLEPIRQDTPANSLSSLVAGLERKVAANPGNIDQQLLLAQTYNELDNREKSLKLLQALNKQAPANAQVKVTLATVLMKGSNKAELKQALQVFEEAIKVEPEVASMARVYQGEIRAKLDKMDR